MGSRVGYKSNRFFYKILRGGNYEQITSYIEHLEKQQKNLEEEIAQLVIYTNGGIPWDVAWQMSPLHRHSVIRVLNKKFEQESGTEYL